MIIKVGCAIWKTTFGCTNVGIQIEICKRLRSTNLKAMEIPLRRQCRDIEASYRNIPFILIFYVS